MSIQACCHWGMAEDVCVVLQDLPTILMEQAQTDVFIHGVCNHVQIPLTKEQARVLAEQLLNAADRCDELEDGLKQYEETE